MNRFMLVLILLIATSCSVSTSPTQTFPTLTLTSESTLTATSTAISVSTIPSPTFARANPTATTQSTRTPAIAATAIPQSPTAASKVLVSPTATSLSGWKTFVSAKLQIALDYPPEWSVSENTNGITFTSPQGALINLARIDTGNENPEAFLNENVLPNTHCSSSVNAHGLKVRTCFDTIAFAYIANFIASAPGGQEELLTLTTSSRGTPEVFNAMVGTVRPAP